MGCTLREEEIFVLEILRKNRCFRSDRGYHHDKLRKLYLKKAEKRGWNTECEECIQSLLNRGYIARIGKSPPKYFISNEKAVFIALGECGIDVRPGRFHPLML